MYLLKLFSIKCNKTKTKVFRLENHKGHRTSTDNPMNQSKQIVNTNTWRETWRNLCQRAMTSFRFTVLLNGSKTGGNNTTTTQQYQYFSTLKWKPFSKVYNYVIAKEFQTIRLHPAIVERTVRAMIGHLCSICPTGTSKTRAVPDCNVSCSVKNTHKKN